jgi:magnesium chelatase family protein
MLSVVQSGTIQGIEALPVQVEVNSGERGELKWVIVGLPDISVKESQNRVFSALGNSGFHLPTSRTTINLAPGDVRKEGPIYDLPIALAVIGATRQAIFAVADQFLIAGELSLSGKTRPICGALNLAVLAKTMGKRGVLLPKKSSFEATFVEGVEVYGIESLAQAVEFLSSREELSPLPSTPLQSLVGKNYVHDISEVRGQKVLKRVVEIAVAGNHNLLIVGPPGCGKSMMAKCIPGILPEPTLEEWIEILKIRSVCGLVDNRKPLARPFRSPHHSISDAGLLGGGSIPRPGEISLAHNGVLFLDELPEFKRSVLELLRQPLEEGCVTVSRSAAKLTFPCRSLLVAAMNPCPCGYLGSMQRRCQCGSAQIQKYRSRISGPLLDRIDLQVEVSGVPFDELRLHREESETSSVVKTRIVGAREAQRRRYREDQTIDMPIPLNAYLSPIALEKYCAIGPDGRRLVNDAGSRLNLSARAYHKILKVARTIADLEGEGQESRIRERHIMEAIQYRCFDRHWA